MRFSLPESLPDHLSYLLKCKNAERLIETLEENKKKNLIEFFRIVCTTDDWITKNNPFLRGRIHYLCDSYVMQLITQRIGVVVEQVLTDKERQLNEMLNAKKVITYEQKAQYSSFIQQERSLYNLFTDRRAFFQLINTEPFVAGMVYERVHELNEIYLTTDPTNESRLPITQAHDLAIEYLLRAEYTPDDHGFLALVEQSLDSGLYDKLLYYLSELTLLPFELKKMALVAEPTDKIIERFRKTKEKHGAILSSADMRRELSKLFNTIDIERTSAQITEEVDDDPKELFDYLKSYEVAGVFFNKFVTHCKFLQSRRKNNGKKLLHFLSILPMPKEFKQYVIFEGYEASGDEMETKFELFRTQLTLQQKSGLYQTLHSIVSAGSTSPPSGRDGQRRNSDGDVDKPDAEIIIIAKKRLSLEKTPE